MLLFPRIAGTRGCKPSMPSKDVLQPNLRSPEDQRFRMAGTFSTEAPSKTRIAAKVVTGLMGVLAAEQFLSTHAVQAQDGEETAPTPEYTPTLTALTNANVRREPSVNAPIIGSLSRDTQATVIDSEQNGARVEGNAVWYQVRLQDGTVGWVWSGAVRYEVTATPTATPEAPTLTATATPIPEHPGATPTAGATEVAMALDNRRFVEASQLERYPRTIRYTNPLTQQEVRITVDPERLSQIKTVNGTPLPLGVYDEQHPLPIDPRMFEGFQEWRGGDLRPAYIVGVLTEVNGAQEHNTQNFYVNPEIVVSIPLPASRDYFPINIFMTTVGGRFGAIDHTGSLVPFPTNLLDNMGRIPYQSNGVNHIVYSSAEDWMTFPTSQGTTILRVGDPVIVRVVFNLDVYTPGYRQSFIVGSSGRMPEQVVADLYDNNPANDGQWYQESSALATVFTPYNEVAQR
jgi:hypothetical protein